MDDEDKQRAYAAQMQALESGTSGVAVPWKNPDSGRYGSVVPGPAYQSNGLQCRQYTHTDLYRRPAADRARHRLPQPRRHLDRGGVTILTARDCLPIPLESRKNRVTSS